MLLRALLIGIIGGVTGMASVIDELQIHRPLIACTLVGLAMGDIRTGIIIGSTLEFMALGWMNIGAAQSPDTALASVISTVLVIGTGQPIATGIAIAVPVAVAGQMLTFLARSLSVYFQHLADRYADQANISGIDFAHISSLSLQFLRVAIPAFLVALYIDTYAVEYILNIIPDFIVNGLMVASGFIVVIGYAMVLNMIKVKNLWPYFFIGFLIAIFTNFTLVGIGILAICLAILHVSLSTRNEMLDEGALNSREVPRERILTRRDLISVFLRSNIVQASWNYERMQALGFCYTIVPVIRRLYKTEEDIKAALKRHLEFFNTQPFFAVPIFGVAAALEEEKASGNDIDPSTINAIKVGMMGPLAGVGDSIFWGTLRPITAAFGASLAATGSLLGPIAFFISFNLVRLLTHWYGLVYGYRAGLNIIRDVSGGTLKSLNQGATVLGMTVMGALVARWTRVSTPITLSYGNQAIKLQEVLDGLLPGLLPLGLTFLCLYLLGKRISSIWILVILFAIGIIGSYLGILA
ncbi:MAG: PTS mannose transporter subunit IID [Clostridiales bacterium]|nr:PTS mannose transporter subunit IID [Clostridiales bacterium]